MDETRDLTGDEPVDDGEAPGDRLEQQESAEQVQAALERVSDEHRRISVLREMEGFCYEKIAEVLSGSGPQTGSVTANLAHRMAEKLRSEQPEITAIQLYAGTARPFDFNGMVRHYYLRSEPWQGELQIPGYTHMQQAMPSSVALWCGGFDEAFADATAGLEAVRRRINKNPLGSAAGYGTPGLPLDRELTTRKLEFAATQSPVTAVQLSRGKAESALLFEITLLLQDLGRMASDLLLFYTQEFAYVSLAADVTTGSSIMPQKRNPDVLELLRASAATAQACLDESLMITAKLPSGYHRDLQRLKPPLFRGIDLAVDSVDIMALVLDGLSFRPENIELDAGSFATEEAYRLVTEDGLAFREAYRRIAEKYK